MIWRVLLIAVAVAMVTMTGCSKKSEPAKPAGAIEQVEDEAPQVTAENLDAELDKMEQEIEADIAAEE